MRDPGVLLSVRKQAIWKEILQKTRLTNYKNHTGREHVAANVVPAFLCLRSFSMPTHLANINSAGESAAYYENVRRIIPISPA